jgi:low affinity Fe/Cu permease
MKHRHLPQRRLHIMGRGQTFDRLAKMGARATGHPLGFGLALLIILGWMITGPLFKFSDTWQLVINTATTIITFLMVFLIQNTQNRDSAAMQIKLDELIRATISAHNALLDLEELSQDELDRFHEKYEALARRARKELQQGLRDDGQPAGDAKPRGSAKASQTA